METRRTQSNVPHDLGTLMEMLRHALEAQDAEEGWTDEEPLALSAHIEEGYQQAERGELIDSAHARNDIQAMKDSWRAGRLPHGKRNIQRLLNLRT